MFQKLTSWEHLLYSFHEARRGKRSNPNVADFEFRVEENLFQLQRELRSRTYQPLKYVHFFIHEPKRRLISAAHFRDRVVHHTLCSLIQPAFEKRFIYDSYANRGRKGTHRAVDRCQQFARKYAYVLPCDLIQFFPAIDHIILRKFLADQVKNPDLLWLIDIILNHGADVLTNEYNMQFFSNDDMFALTRPRGLPIGNLTSQFWANVYMNPFDHFVKRELGCRGYLRYVDDFLLFANSKEVLWKHLQAIEKRLEYFRMKLHPTHPRPVTEGIPYLGFVVYPQKRRLKRRKGIFFQRRFNKKVKEFQEGKIGLDEVSKSVKAWVNHARYANTTGLRKAILSKKVIGPPVTVKR